MDFTERYGPWALVTGASSGIGEQFARVLAERGLNVVISARRADRIEALAESLRSAHGVEMLPVVADLGDAAGTAAIVDAVAGLDLGLVVSNAGFGLKGVHAEQDPVQLDAMLNVNCRAPMQFACQLIPRLVGRGRGGLIITGSIEGFIGFPWSAAYAATKAFVLSLGEAVAFELRDTGVDLEVLCPGSTDTEALVKQGFNPQEMRGLMPPRAVVEQALANLGRRAVFVPGGGNRFFARLLSNLPRAMAVSFAGNAMRSAVRKSRATGH